MGTRILLPAILLSAVAASAPAQQVSDLGYHPPISRPAYPAGGGPRVAIDAAHQNFHTADGRYRPFAELLRRDGYRVEDLGAPLSADSLKDVGVLVIANALHARNAEDWSLPTPSAFMPQEIAAVHAWVRRGGSLFLIVDHMPFSGAAADLAGAFGVRFSNGYAVPGNRGPGASDSFELGAGLKESAVTRGRTGEERITRVATFAGSAFQPPKAGVPVLVFGAGAFSHETEAAPGITPGALKIPIAGWCQGAILQADRGRVAIFGEAAMFSAQLAGPGRFPVGMNAPGAEQNHQLLLNVVHWLTRVEGRSR